MKDLKLVIFDLDGTLLETREDLANAVNYALETLGYPKRSVDQIRSFVGNGMRNLVRCSLPGGLPEEETDRMLQVFTPYYMAHCADKTYPYAGLAELVVRLRQSGYKTAVVSNKKDDVVQYLCRLYFPGLFDFVCGEREGVRKKPAPDSVFEVMRMLGVSADATVYVGDSEVDITTARNASVRVQIVSWGFRSKEELTASGAERIADTPDELERILRD